MKRQLGGGDVSDIAGLMGPLGLPGVAAGVLSKLSPDDVAALHELLGKPFRLGKRLLRLSSGDPAKNRGIVHTSEGERIATPLDELLKLFQTHGEDIDDFDTVFPEGAVVSRPGVEAPSGSFGPRGGVPKRKLPERGR